MAEGVERSGSGPGSIHDGEREYLAFWGRLGCRGGGVGLCCRFLFRAAQHLFESDGKRAALGGADQRQREERQAQNRLATQRGKEAIKSKHVFAGFGHDRLITAEEIHIIGLKEVGAKEEPGQSGPWQKGREKR